MTPPDVPAELARIRAELTGPGGEFEVDGTRGFVRLPGPGTLGGLVRESAELADRECLVADDLRLDFAAHAATVGALAVQLREQFGVRPGARVAIVAANSPEWIVAFWATVSLGAVAALGNAWWSPAEAAHALDLAEPRVVVADEPRAALAGHLPLLPTEAVRGLLAAGAAEEIPACAAGGDAAVITYTSGTTGRAKGSVHTHAALLQIARYHLYTDRLGERVAELLGRPAPARPRRFLMSLPLFHIASLHNLVVPRLASGDTVHVATGRFDAADALDLVERERITNWAVVPTMAGRLAAAAATRERDLRCLTALSINSAPSSPQLKARVLGALGGRSGLTGLADSYGLTESGTAATVATALDLLAAPESVGPPIPGVELSVRDAAGAPLPDGADGEIWLRSPYAMQGYWRDVEATTAALDADGWLHTGDLGRLHDGRLFMAARRSDLILRGGENVYPAEVEAVLHEHPQVAECAVLGIADDDLGERVVAVVRLAGRADDAELAAWARARLAGYKVPAGWYVVDEPLPRTATGKVIRPALAAIVSTQNENVF